jgi:hypothetical protein
MRAEVEFYRSARHQEKLLPRFRFRLAPPLKDLIDHVPDLLTRVLTVRARHQQFVVPGVAVPDMGNHRRGQRSLRQVPPSRRAADPPAVAGGRMLRDLPCLLRRATWEQPHHGGRHPLHQRLIFPGTADYIPMPPAGAQVDVDEAFRFSPAEPLDGSSTTKLDCYGSGMLARRSLFSSVPAGRHSIVLEMTGGKNPSSGGWCFYSDYLECAVSGDVPDAPQTRGDVGLATDFDTDHPCRLSPQRLIWHLQKPGLVGEIDHYCGVFWWNERKAVGGNHPSATVTYEGSFVDQEMIWLNVGDGAIGKTVFPADTPETIAAHFAYFVNATLVGVWASLSGPVLTITCRSTGGELAVFALSGYDHGARDRDGQREPEQWRN